MKTNCPNCGAVIEPLQNKCSYCGTSYFDLSSIDLNSTEPFYLKIRYKGLVLTQLVRPSLSDITISKEDDVVYAISNHNHDQRVATFCQNSIVKTSINFESVKIPDKNSLMIIEKDEES